MIQNNNSKDDPKSWEKIGGTENIHTKKFIREPEDLKNRDEQYNTRNEK